MSGVKKQKNLSTPLLVTTCYTPDIYSPILYSLAIAFTYFWTLWLPLLHLFSPFTPLLHKPFGYHSYIPFPLLHPFYIFLNPLATTLTSLFPYYTPFTYCWTQVQRAGTIRSSFDKSHICLSQTSHWEIWWQRCSFNLQACRKIKQARSTCVVASLLGMHGTENLVWANDLLKGDQDTANMIWSMSHQKISMKKQKIQRP